MITQDCAWCGDPTDETRHAQAAADPTVRLHFCAVCWPAATHPAVSCETNPQHAPTCGPVCAECQWESERKARVQAANAPQLEQLRKIREDLIREIKEGPHWSGCNFGKAILGNAVNQAIAALES